MQQRRDADVFHLLLIDFDSDCAIYAPFMRATAFEPLLYLL